MAIETKSRETVEVHLNFSKAAANIPNWLEVTPLAVAVQGKHFDEAIVEMLLGAGTSLPIPSNFVGTAIHGAAFSGPIEALRMLLDQGCCFKTQSRKQRDGTR
jgi:ankyrin repeat protein